MFIYQKKYLACALNSACLALLDAGVPLKYTFGAVCCSVIENADRVVFFPSLKQEKVKVVIINYFELLKRLALIF